MRGRKPKPSEQRAREGKAGHRPLPAPVTVGARKPPARPKTLTGDAREAWDRIVPLLDQVGIVNEVDVMALEALCTQWARAKQAGRVIDEFGHVTLGSTGQLTEHPSLGTERTAHQLFLRFAEQYALTPVARTRLGLAEIQRRSLAEELRDQLGDRKLRKVRVRKTKTKKAADVVEGEAEEIKQTPKPRKPRGRKVKKAS